MTKMTKKIRTLLALGVVTVATASTVAPVNALSKATCKNQTVKGAIYVYINGVKYELPMNSGCPNKPCVPAAPAQLKPCVPATKPCAPAAKPATPATKPATPAAKPATPAAKPAAPAAKPAAPAAKPAAPADNNSNTTVGNFSAFQKEVVDLVNVERTNRGLNPLKLDEKLSNVATTKSQDMINKNYFDHTSPTYGSPFDMMKQFGISYKSAGENIAMGQNSPKEVVTAWMNSPGHRANILNSSFTDIGVGIAKNSSGSIYWTQMFIGK